MNLSVWSGYFVSDEVESMVKKMIKAGFRCTEFSNEHTIQMISRGEKSYPALKKYLEDHNFSVPQGHLNFLKTSKNSDENADLASLDESLRRASLDWWKRELELYETIGVKYAVLHPGGGSASAQGDGSGQKIREKRLESLNELLEFTQGMKVMICLENMPQGECIVRSGDLLEVIRSLSHSNIGICFDTGHLNIRKEEEPEDFIRACGKYLHALHIADNNGVWDEHLLPRRGSINWDKTVHALKETGYDQLVNFEIPGCSLRFCCGDTELKELYLPFIKRFGEKLFAELE